MNFIFILFIILVSGSITALATIITIPLAKKFGFMDDPKTHNHPAILHKKPIPRAGGIPLFLGILITYGLLRPFTQTTIALFIAAGISVVMGILDDKYDISSYLRFGVNIICALIVVANGITIPFITHPLGGILQLQTISLTFFGLNIHISDILAVIWIIWVMNMLNWSKGVDGQMPGIVAIAGFVIGLLSLRFTTLDEQTLTSAFLSFAITGASLGFLIFNFYPAKIFPGYSATALYLILASVSILASVKLATAILVMGVPMTDGIFTITRRLYNLKSPFIGDKKHLHHLLLEQGFGQRRVALFYWLFSAIVGGASLLLSSSGKLFTLVTLVVVVSGGLLFLHVTRQKNHQ